MYIYNPICLPLHYAKYMAYMTYTYITYNTYQYIHYLHKDTWYNYTIYISYHTIPYHIYISYICWRNQKNTGVIGLVQRTFYRKEPYFMGKTMVCCRLSRKPIHWWWHSPAFQIWFPPAVRALQLLRQGICGRITICQASL